MKIVGTVTGDVYVSGNVFADNKIQVDDSAEALVLEDVLADNTFDRAVVIDHLATSLLPMIYSYIQEAIDATSTEDTILVYPGIYTENIVISVQELILRSVEPYGAEIVGKMTIKGVTGVSVDGFKISAPAVHPTNYIAIWVWADGGTAEATIENNLIDGSALWPAQTQVAAIETTGSVTLRVLNNHFTNLRRGVYGNPDSVVPEITGNIFENGVLAIALESTLPSLITGNTIINYERGLEVNTGVRGVGNIHINYNNIIVSGCAVKNFGSFEVDAQFNYWGTADPLLIEAMISEFVDYDPWLSGPYPGGVPVSLGDLVLTGKARYPMVSIAISGFTGDFGDIITGIPTPFFRVIVTNTGEITVNVTAEMTKDPDDFYTNYLKIADETGTDYVKPDETMIQDLPGKGYSETGGGIEHISLRLEVPLTAVEPREYTGTLFFIAEAVCEITP